MVFLKEKAKRFIIKPTQTIYINRKKTCDFYNERFCGQFAHSFRNDRDSFGSQILFYSKILVKHNFMYWCSNGENFL